MSVKLYINGLIIDGKGSKIENGAVKVENNVILDVGGAHTFNVNEADEVVDLQGKTMMPGLIDAHTHHSRTSSSDSVNEVMKYYLSLRTLRTYLNFRTTLEAGFTAVRDVGAIGYVDIAVRTIVNEGKLIGPHIIAAGRSICQTGGHPEVCSQYPWAKADDAGPEIADGEAEVRRAVRKQVRMGADFIKIFVTSGIHDPFTGKPRPEYSENEIKAMIEEAHAVGKKAVMHCHSAEMAKLCIKLGADSIEHGMFIDEECLNLMIENGVFWVPTLLVYNNMANGLEKGVMPSSVENAKRGLEKEAKIFKKALELGVKIGVGTDAGTILTPHGENAKELELLHNWGMSAMDCIKAATADNAELLGIAKKTGSIEKGKEVDLLIVEGNPLENIGILQDKNKIVVIIKGGEYIKNLL